MGNERCHGIPRSEPPNGNESSTHEGVSSSSEGEVRELQSQERSVHRMVDEKGEVMTERTRKLLADLNDCINTIDRCIHELEEVQEEIEKMFKERKNDGQGV